jgi:ATP-binding cassette subfamily B protein
MKYIWRILNYARELRRYYISIGLLTILTSATVLLIPLLTGRAIDEISQGTSAELKFVIWIAVGLFVLDVAATFLNNISGYLGDQMAVKLNKILSERYFKHLLTLPQGYFDKELSGALINRLNRSVQQLSNFMNMFSNNFLQFIFSTIFSLIAVAVLSWQVALLLFALYPIYVWMTVRTSDKWQKYQTEKNLNYDIASGRFAEAISQIKVIKSFVQERREMKFFTKHLQKAVHINQPQSKYWHEQDIKRRLALNLIFFGVYVFIFVQATNASISPGEAVALILLAMQIRIPIFTISFLVESVQRAVADSREYFEVMNVQPEITDSPGASVLKVTKGAITFDNVSFGYDDKHTILHDISLSVSPDSKIALVGESGEGKTTLTNLLLRLYEPQSGSISIDSHDIANVTQKSLRESIGVVFQDPALFSGTIKENIGYSNEKATDAQIVAAAKAANAHEFISKLDDGYDAQIGERGLKLSGGQKQRIAIARALLKDAPILILDEATSSLDSKSEQMVQEALQRLMKGRTTLIIAHRLSTIQNVDQIVTLRGGTIDEIGKPDELAETDGIYGQLLRLQQRPPTEQTKKRLEAFDIAS